MTTTHDYIIAGAGCAGLSLAWRLITQAPSDQVPRILLIDPDDKVANDRTWCFWDRQAPQLPCEPAFAWNQLTLFGPDGHQQALQLGDLTYYQVRGDDFYAASKAALRQFPQVTWLKERVQAFDTEGQQALVYTDTSCYRAPWAFSSIPPKKKHAAARHDHLLQHFFGYFVRTEHPVFDPHKPVLMDFRCEQGGEVRFYYLLPYSEREALIEFTVFSENVWPAEAYQPFLQAYLAGLRAKGSGEIAITDEETGVIPMTTAPFPRWINERVMQIGLAGGAARPGTGYAFQRIQQQTQTIAEALLANGAPVAPAGQHPRHRFYDTLLLYLIKREGGRISHIFRKLFQRQPAHRVLRFLAEQTTLPAELWIMARLPWPPFLRALWHGYLMRRRPAPQPSFSPDPVPLIPLSSYSHAHRSP